MSTGSGLGMRLQVCNSCPGLQTSALSASVWSNASYRCIGYGMDDIRPVQPRQWAYLCQRVHEGGVEYVTDASTSRPGRIGQMGEGSSVTVGEGH